MFANIESLRLRAIALRSSIHNEQQLSAIELAGMNAKKTNEIIDVVNELCESIEKLEIMAHELNVKYDEVNEGLALIMEG